MLINNKFNIGDEVYLKTDIEQLQRIITGIKLFGKHDMMYQLSCGKDYSDHYDFEISEIVNEDLRVKNL